MQNITCVEDREGNRYSDKCHIKHSDIGDTYSNKQEKMRKIIISKQLKSHGQERAKIYKDNVLQFEILIDPGFNDYLFHATDLFVTFNNVKVEVETVLLGENETSEFTMHCEWVSS